MRLVKMTRNPGSGATVYVRCSHVSHNLCYFPLEEGYANIDGRPYLNYYCEQCVTKSGWQKFIVEVPAGNS